MILSYPEIEILVKRFLTKKRLFVGQNYNHVFVFLFNIVFFFI